MFIIPCKFSKKSNSIISLVSQIRHFHPSELIMVVDSDSEDKEYFIDLEPFNIVIEDVANKNWMVGAYWHGYQTYPNEDFYFCFHDSMNVKANLNYLKERDLFTLATFNRSVGGSFNAWNDRIRNETTIDPKFIHHNGKGCYGPIFGCKNKVMKSLYEKNAHKLLPSNKTETGYMEGAFGLFFESLGYDLTQCALYGDILELESEGGKSGPPPHNTSWQFPIEKFYLSHIDEGRK